MSNGYNYSGYTGDQGHDVPPPHNQHMQQQQEHRQQPPGQSYPTDYDHDNQMYYQQQQQHMDSGYPPSSMPGSDVPDPSYYSPPTGDPQYQPSHYNQPPPSQHHHQQPPPPQQQHSHLPPPQHQQHQQHYSRSQPYDTVDLYDQADSYATSDHRYSSHEPPHVSSYSSKPVPHHSPELHATVPPGRHIDNTSTTPRRSHTSSFSNVPPESSMGTAGGAAGLRGRPMTRQPSHPPVGMPDHSDHHMSGHSMGQHASNASRHGHGGPMGQHQPQGHRSSGHSSGAPSHHVNHTAGYPSNPGPVSGYPPQDYPSPSHRPSHTSSGHVAGYPSGHPSGRASSRPPSMHAGSGSGGGVAPSTGASRGQPGMRDGSQRTASRGLGPGQGPGPGSGPGPGPGPGHGPGHGQRPRPDSIHQISPRSHPASLHGNAPPSMPSNQGYSSRHVSQQPTAIPNERQSFDSRAGSVDYAHVPSLMPRDHQPMENRRDLRGEHRDRAPSVAHSVASAPSKRPGGPPQIASKEKIDALRQRLSFKLLELARRVKTVTHQYRGKGNLTKEDKDQLREGLCKFESQQVKAFLKMNDIEGYRNVMEKRRKLLALRLKYFEEVLKLQKEFLPLVQGVLKKYNEGFRLEQSPEKRREYQAHIANLMSYEKHLKAPDELHKVKGLDYVVSARNYLTKLREHYERRREAANRNGAQSYSQGRAAPTQPQQPQQHQQQQQGGVRQPTSHGSTPAGNASSRYPPQHADARQQSQAYPSSHRSAQQSPQLTSTQRQILYEKQQRDLHWQQKEKEMKAKLERERRQTLELEKRQQEEAARRKKLELQKRQEEAQRLKEQKLQEEQNKQRLLEQQRKAQLMQERQQIQQRQQQQQMQQQMQQDKIRQQQLLAQQQQQQQQQKPQQHPQQQQVTQGQPSVKQEAQQQQQQQVTQGQPAVKPEAQQQRPLVQNVYMPSQRGAAAGPNQVTAGVGPTGTPGPSVPPSAGQVKTGFTAQNQQTQQQQASSHQVGPRQGQPPASQTQVQTQPQARLKKNLPPQGVKAEQQSKTSPSSRSTSSGGNKTSRPDDDTLQPNNKKQRVGGIVDAYDTPASVMESIPTPGNLAQVASTSPEAVLPSRRQVIDIGPGVAASLDPACSISNLGSKGCYRALRQFTGWA